MSRYRYQLYDRLLRVVDTHPGYAIPSKNKTENKRGVIRGISAKSRRRLMEYLATVGRCDPVLFVTLTYREWVDDRRVWRAHLCAFYRRLKRAFPEHAGFWRLEFQQRKAPHWHLLLWGVAATRLQVGKLCRDWWLEIIGDQSLAARRHAVKVQDVDDVRACGFYLALYQAKDVQDRKDIETGREWGVWGKERLQIAPLKEGEGKADSVCVLRRILRRAYQSQHRATYRASFYWRSLRRAKDSFATFIPLEVSSRLLRYLEAECEQDPF